MCCFLHSLLAYIGPVPGPVFSVFILYLSPDFNGTSKDPTPAGNLQHHTRAVFTYALRASYVLHVGSGHHLNMPSHTCGTRYEIVCVRNEMIRMIKVKGGLGAHAVQEAERLICNDD